MKIFESILDGLETSELDSVSVRNRTSSRLQPGEWQFCLMCPDWTSKKQRVIEDILRIYSSEYHITRVRECPEIDSVMVGSSLGNISDYDAAVLEFDCPDMMSKVKCLFYILYHSGWCAFFIPRNEKYVFRFDNEETCSAVRTLVLLGKLKLDMYGRMNSFIYEMIWPDVEFDMEHSDELMKYIGKIKMKCEKLAEERKKGYNII